MQTRHDVAAQLDRTGRSPKWLPAGRCRSRFTSLVMIASLASLLPCTLGLAGEPVRFFEPNAETGSSGAVVVSGGPLLHTGQVTPPVPSEEFDMPLSPDEQVQAVLSELQETLQFASSDLARVVKLNVYVSHPTVSPIVEQTLAKRYAGDHKPAVTYVTTALPIGCHMVAMDAVAETNRPTMPTVERFAGRTTGAPAAAAILPPGPRIYLSNHAEEGDGSTASAARATMASVLQSMASLGLKTRDVVQLRVYVVPVDEAPVALAEITACFAGEVPPPVTLVEWESELPVGIELVAAARDDFGNAPAALAVAPVAPVAKLAPVEQQLVEYVHFANVPAHPLYAHAVRMNATRTLYVGGLRAAPQITSTEEQMQEVFAGLRRLTDLSGASMQHLVKATYYSVDDDADLALDAAVTHTLAAQQLPAGSRSRVAGVGDEQHTLSLDMIAALR